MIGSNWLLVFLLGALGFESVGAQTVERGESLRRRAAFLSELRYPTEEEWGAWREAAERLTRDFPEDATGWYWRGVLADREGKLDEGEKFLAQSLAVKGPPEVQAKGAALLGTMRLAGGAPSEGLRLARRSLELDPRSLEGARLLRDAAFALGDEKEARRLVPRAQAQDPEATSEWIELAGEILLERGEWRELETLARDRLARFASCPAGHHFAGLLAFRRGDETGGGKHEVMAVLTGTPTNKGIAQAQDYVSRRVVERLSGKEESAIDLFWVQDMVARYEIGARRGLELDWSDWDKAKQLANGLPSEEPMERLLAEYLTLTLDHLRFPSVERREAFEKLLAVWPDFVPALCRSAECDELDPDPVLLRKAIEKRKQAAALAPAHPLVRDFLRLGARVHLSEAGVWMDEVVEGSPLEGLGVVPDSEVVAIDGIELLSLSPGERLRRVRFFSGGKMLVRLPGGMEKSLEMPSRLLD